MAKTAQEIAAEKQKKKDADIAARQKAKNDAVKKAGNKKTDDKKSSSKGKTQEQVNAESEAAASRVAANAGKFGDDLASKYLPSGTFGTLQEGVSPEMQAYLARLNEFAQGAGNYTNYETTGLNALEAGLGGYSAPELQAQREGITQNINQDLATQLRIQELANARNRVRGAAAGAGAQQLQSQAQMARGNAERDLFAKNADVMQARKEAFANIVNQTEAARFGRKNVAEAGYGGALTGEEGYQNAIKQYNIGQRQNEALSRGNLALSGAGIYTGLYGGEQGANLARDNLDVVRDQNKANQEALQKNLEILRAQSARYGSQAAATGGA